MGNGPLTKVFKARSNHFNPPQYYYAIRVLLPIQAIQESEIQKIYAQSKHPIDSNDDDSSIFVRTFEIVRFQSSLVQIKKYHPTSLQTLISSAQDRKLIDSLFLAIRELAEVLEKSQIEHGNIKATNVFVEHSSGKNNYRVRLVLSDPCFFTSNAVEDTSKSMYTQDNIGLANLMHLLVCGLYICFLPSGKALFHSKVKNSGYFKDIRHLLDGRSLKRKP